MRVVHPVDDAARVDDALAAQRDDVVITRGQVLRRFM